MDTCRKTETSGIMITPLPGATALKPSSATFPLFGICPELVDSNAKVLDGPAQGNLAISQSWPG
jgi:acetyl-CoA synthetase